MSGTNTIRGILMVNTPKVQAKVRSAYRQYIGNQLRENEEPDARARDFFWVSSLAACLTVQLVLFIFEEYFYDLQVKVSTSLLPNIAICFLR
jgi:hypothetical protein